MFVQILAMFIARSRFIPLVLLVLSVSMSSCATLFTGLSQNVTVETNPPGAEVVLEGRSQGVAPVKFRIPKSMDLLSDGGKDIVLRKEGYEDDYFLEANINPISILNLTNLLAWGIDVVSGAVMRFDRYYMIDLLPAPEPPEQTVPPATVQPSKTQATPPAATTRESPQQDKYDRLRKIKALFDEGILTEEEYQSEKKKILSEQ